MNKIVEAFSPVTDRVIDRTMVLVSGVKTTALLILYFFQDTDKPQQNPPIRPLGGGISIY